jgi:hypothetical protein
MTFHEQQVLARSVLEEVVINDNVVKLYFKIPLPKPEPDPAGTPKRHTDHSLSRQFHLRLGHDEQVGTFRLRADP